MALHSRAKELAPKVKYEWQMFEYVSKQIQETSVGTGTNRLEQSMLLECFLLHVRVLYDFFKNTSPSSGDIVAEHFFDSSDKWRKIATQLCHTVAAEKSRINKKLAHLTVKRLELEENWEVQGIGKEISEAWRRFLAELPADRRSWFE